MEELKDDIDEEFMDIVLDIEKLLGEEFLDGEPIRPQIDELLSKLETSEIPKSNQHQIKTLLGDITKNRYRIEQIIQRLMDAEDKEEMSTIYYRCWFVKDSFRMSNSSNLVSWKIQT